MSTKINKHVFHGVYSNFGYKPSFSSDKRLANYPIHFFRASFGEKNGSTVKEFETEEEVLKWYKKNKYGESAFNELEFPKDICKNYFVISDSEFFKYRELFHGMIKGIKMDSDIEITCVGTSGALGCEQCKKSSGDDGYPGGGKCSPSTATVTFQSPNGEPSYFSLTGGADDVGFLNGKQISDGTLGDASGAAGPFNQEKIPKTKETTLTVQGKNNPYYCGPYGIEARVQWFSAIKYKQTIKFKINFDSTKIFDFPGLQKRLPADNLEYITNIDLKENKNKEELISKNNKKVFKDEWQFDNTKFKSIFEAEKSKFNFNATFLNDPVLLQQSEAGLNIEPLSIRNTHTFESDGLTTEIVDKQKNFSKNFEKFGLVEYKINNDNSLVLSSQQSLNFFIEELFYIRSQKKYLCFIELDGGISLNSSIISKNEDCESECEDLSTSSSSSEEPSSESPSSDSSAGQNAALMLHILKLLEDEDVLQALETENIVETLQEDTVKILEVDSYSQIGNANPFGIEYMFTTNDLINKDPVKYKTSDCDTEEKELEFARTECEIKLLNKTFKIELFELKEKEFIFDNSKCEDLDPVWLKDIKQSFKINYVKKPTFEILTWDDSDFNTNNIFPPKFS